MKLCCIQYFMMMSWQEIVEAQSQKKWQWWTGAMQIIKSRGINSASNRLRLWSPETRHNVIRVEKKSFGNRKVYKARMEDQYQLSSKLGFGPIILCNSMTSLVMGQPFHLQTSRFHFRKFWPLLLCCWAAFGTKLEIEWRGKHSDKVKQQLDSYNCRNMNWWVTVGTNYLMMMMEINTTWYTC